MNEQDIQVETPDGVAEAILVTPTSGAPASGVILYMDAFGLRPALVQIAGRIAANGYAVLVPDILYRGGRHGPFDAQTAFKEAATGDAIRAAMSMTTQAMTQADTAAFIESLTGYGVDGPIATLGYCMGGARAINAAAAHPDRVVAAASFHGGNLANDAPDSPQKNASALKARVYVGSAGEDKSFPPEQAGKLAEAFRANQVDYILENYVGVGHGWCIPDHNAYDLDGSERHMKRLMTLFSETLGH